DTARDDLAPVRHVEGESAVAFAVGHREGQVVDPRVRQAAAPVPDCVQQRWQEPPGSCERRPAGCLQQAVAPEIASLSERALDPGSIRPADDLWPATALTYGTGPPGRRRCQHDQAAEGNGRDVPTPPAKSSGMTPHPPCTLAERSTQRSAEH